MGAGAGAEVRPEARVSGQFSDWEVTEAMIRYGGGFVSALGELYRKGDEINRRKLVAAFPEYFDQYQDARYHVYRQHANEH